MPGTLPPAGQAGRAAQPTPSDHRESRAIPNGKPSPWCRPASTAINPGRYPIAMTEVAGPSPVLAYPGIRQPTLINSDAANWFQAARHQRKSTRCDLLHKGPDRVALNLRHAPENAPAPVRPESGHPDRLRLDRHRRRSGPVRADLSHPGLISAENPARPTRLTRSEYVPCGIRFTPRRYFPDFFGDGAPPTEISRKPVKRQAETRQAPICHSSGIHT
jgi:hypothetical protein